MRVAACHIIAIASAISVLAGCSSADTAIEPDLDDAAAEASDTGSQGEDTSVDETDSFTEDSGALDTATDDSTVLDSGSADTGSSGDATSDTTLADAFMPDTFVPDTFVPDTFVDDTIASDTFVPDTFVADTFVPDTFVPDTFVPDTFVPDTSPVLGCETPAAITPTSSYTTLSSANFYVLGVTTAIRSCFGEYRPSYELWSDGLVKRRFLYLPPGTTIATGPNPVTGAAPNMDRWIFPVGTRFIKEFARSDGKKLETRIWERTTAGYRFGSFRWRADQSDADYTEGGGAALLTLDDGTVHTIPKRAECVKCHDGEPGQGLGFSAVQLSRAAATSTEVTLNRLIADGWLSHPPASLPTPNGSPVPGTAIEADALGAMHANCGHCHNPLGDAAGIDMQLRVRFGEINAATSLSYTTTVGVLTKKWNKYGITLRIDPGAAGAGNGSPPMSAVHFRASVRGTPDEMPPLGTTHPDTTGLLKALDAWIRTL